MNRLLTTTALISALALAGCAASITPAPAGGVGASVAVGPAPSTDPLVQFANFTVADLNAAQADAVVNKDTISMACYPALVQFIQSLPSSNAGTTVVGAFSAFQKARDLRNVAVGGIPTYLTMGCGPLYAQVHGDLLTFLGGVGGTVLGGIGVAGLAAP